MRLLIVTQVVDSKHPVLGFFHRWIEELAKRFDALTVICLEEGTHVLPHNVRVISLGKRSGTPTGALARLRYAARFYRALSRERGRYDAVFVHMNQEYVLLAGWYWLVKRIPVYLWRNHYAGSLLTDIAALFCRKVFCTSRYSYTAKYMKTVRMPVGTDATPSEAGTVHIPGSILSLGRIAPSKNIHVIVEALGALHAEGVSFTATIRGTTGDDAYVQDLRTMVDERHMQEVAFGDAVPKSETYLLYGAHEIFVNASPSGMLDKTIFSAMMNGCVVVASSGDFSDFADPRCLFKEGDAHSLAHALKGILSLSHDERRAIAKTMQRTAQMHTLEALCDALKKEIV